MTFEPQHMSNCPPFAEAVQSFRRFLADQGCSDQIRWIWREDICSRRAPGSQRSWNRSVYVHLAGTSETSLVERYYNSGLNRGPGLSLEVFCVAAGLSCCFVYVPEDEEDASYRMISGLKLSVPTSPILAVAVRHSLLWMSLRLIIGTSNSTWIQDLPRKGNAERVPKVIPGSIS